jgi:protein arginine kinase
MLLDTLSDKAPAWLSGDKAEGEAVVLTQCSLARNLADFPFPNRCSPEEKRQIIERVQTVFDSLNLLSSGQFYHLEELGLRELRFLAERRLVTYEFLRADGPRAVYVSDDQGLAIMVNGADHLCARTICAGLQPQEAWARLNLMDDTLVGTLDYAFDERLGYLTSALAHVGTGLKASVMIHLPALSLGEDLARKQTAARSMRFTLAGVRAGVDDPRLLRKMTRERPTTAPDTLLGESFFSDMSGAVCGPMNEASGDLFLLVNEGTLGISEEEIVFHLRHLAVEIVEKERQARQQLFADSPRGLEDRVGRARGVAGGARLMGFAEAVGLLSSLRLGVATKTLSKCTVGQLNELLLNSQRAHLEVAAGHALDELSLSVERAELFRNRFGAA